MSGRAAPDWEAVSFDAGGTLIQPNPSVGHVYAAAALAGEFGRFEPDDLSRRFLEAWRGRGPFDYTKGAWANVVADTFAGLIAAPDLPALFEAIYERFAAGTAWEVPPDVKPCLEKLRSRRLRLAVISNFDERLFRVLTEVGLAGYFEFIVASGPLGVHKPAAAIYLEAARRLGLPTARILHVGDSDPEDVAGARNAGLGAVLLDRSGNERGPDSLNSLAELPQWIRRRTPDRGDKGR